MKQLLILIVTFVFSSGAYSCAVPNSGPKYDRLIEIVKLDDKGAFSIQVPQKVGSSELPVVTLLKYSEESYKLLTDGPVKKRLENGESVTNEEYDAEYKGSQPTDRIEISLNKAGSMMKGEFQVQLESGVKHTVHVYWAAAYCCVCMTNAHSIALEHIGPNKTLQQNKAAE